MIQYRTSLPPKAYWIQNCNRANKVLLEYVLFDDGLKNIVCPDICITLCNKKLRIKHFKCDDFYMQKYCIIYRNKI